MEFHPPILHRMNISATLREQLELDGRVGTRLVNGIIRFPLSLYRRLSLINVDHWVNGRVINRPGHYLCITHQPVNLQRIRGPIFGHVVARNTRFAKRDIRYEERTTADVTNICPSLRDEILIKYFAGRYLVWNMNVAGASRCDLPYANRFWQRCSVISKLMLHCSFDI